MIKKVLLLAMYFCLLLTTKGFAQVSPQKAEFVIIPQFGEAYPFSEGLGCVKLNRKWGYINHIGQPVIPYQYEEALPFSQDLAPVKVGKLWGYIDKSNKIVIEPQYETALQFTEDLAPVEKKKLWGFINKTGDFIIQPQYKEAKNFKEGKAPVQIRSQWGFIDKTGNIIIEPQFKEAWPFKEGYSKVQIYGFLGKTYGLINKIGAIVISSMGEINVARTLVRPNELSGVTDFSGNLAAVKYEDSTMKSYNPIHKESYNNNVWNFIDKSGQLVIKGNYYEAGTFSEELAMVRESIKYTDTTGYVGYRGGVCIYINIKGEEILRTESYDAGEFSEGLAPVKLERWGYIRHPLQMPRNNDDPERPEITLINPQAKFGDAITSQEKEITLKGNVKASSGTDRVFVNDKQAVVQANGDFQAIFALGIGKNQVTIEATDKQANTGTFSFIIEREGQVAAVKSNVIKLPRTWAVVIGISQYQDKNITAPKFARKDAEDFYSFLTSPAGGSIPGERIKLLINEMATRAAIIKSLNEIFYEAFDDDRVILYLACQGQPDSKSNEMFLLGYDADAADPSVSSISQSVLQRAFRNTKATNKLFFADITRSSNTNARTNAAALSNKFLTDIANSADDLTGFVASSGNEFSQEDARWGGGHGIFTLYLLEGLKGKANKDGNTVITLNELYEYVSQNVIKNTGQKQRPGLLGSYNEQMPISLIRR